MCLFSCLIAQRLLSVPVPDSMQVNVDALLQWWNYESVMPAYERQRVVLSLEASGMRFWHVLAKKVRF